jgi:hypothetical protein
VAGPSLSLNDDHLPRRQREHLDARARMGAICFLAVLFARRSLKTRTDPREAWMLWWPLVSAATSVNRHKCGDVGVQVQWVRMPRCRIEEPDMLGGIKELVRKFD